MEQYITEAIGLGRPQLQVELVLSPEIETLLKVTIYDFAALLSKNEPEKVSKSALVIGH
ncbi:hypothetical protein GNE08_21590 [Trichormus variabilis ARAD]|uniref:Uncharacterized protein n=1 Tax=Trichormus variabilis N2B TaxID=2681315 RepID=A0ABR6SDC7_ANAVA|nr:MULTISPECIES: hypothetical protein [Nostocaceae]MBC1216803.1 hypothetical protein [Trichormus variabilis ARAD]MBC1254384.1 hypothetical protein [Trichormus variabilis V5]MBC1269587.1 hypothetical protein [Trichormus variabilis FSR]MBC1304420.1 hypothetical protein [Trichormus variabilis N2B]MBC1312894.1 hypothetical protein [Trichormus variabilis PNB]